MSFRKSRLFLSFVALMSLPTLAQDQTSQTSNAQPQASQPQASSKDQSSKDQSKDQTADQTAQPLPPQDPAPTPDSASSGSDSAPSGPPPIQEPDDSKVKHNGTKSDVDAIGNPKVCGPGLGNWYSLENEITIGTPH